MSTTRQWPASDRRRALLRDLAILLGRGYSVAEAAAELDVPLPTAYRWAARIRP